MSRESNYGFFAEQSAGRLDFVFQLHVDLERALNATNQRLNLNVVGNKTFIGVVATFTVDSYSQITLTVPAGATTGKIVVTTAGGSGSSSTSFTVT
jgi:hypothetical protein